MPQENNVVEHEVLVVRLGWTQMMTRYSDGVSMLLQKGQQRIVRDHGIVIVAIETDHAFPKTLLQNRLDSGSCILEKVIMQYEVPSTVSRSCFHEYSWIHCKVVSRPPRGRVREQCLSPRRLCYPLSQKLAVACDHIAGSAVLHQSSVVQEQCPVTEVSDILHRMGYEHNCLARVAKLLNAFKRLLLESDIADAKDLVNNQNIGLHFDGYREGQSHIHA